MLAMAYMLTQVVLARVLNIAICEDRVCLVCMSGSVKDWHHFLWECAAYNHIHQQYSHLFHQRQSVLTSPF